VLHAVEDGLVTLIGATTENPYFEVNQALLSRCTVIELEPLSLADLARVIERGAEALGSDVPEEVADEIARRAGGDARTALQTLELAWETASTAGEPLAAGHVEDAARKRPLRYDRDGDRHYDLTSAFIKSMRGGDPDAAVYYLAAMLEGGEDPRFLARRMVIAASEDVGDADPTSLLVAVAAAQALEHVGLPEAQLNLAQAAIHLARAPKSNAVARAIWQAREDVRRDGIQPPPPPLRDAHYKAAASRGHGVGYVSPHDDPSAALDDHLPEGMQGRTYYRPSSTSEEAEEARRDDRNG
jgi:putative ATPase